MLAQATASGANLSAIARRHGLRPAQVYKWRRLAELGVIGVPEASELPSFVAVEIAQGYHVIAGIGSRSQAGGQW